MNLTEVASISRKIIAGSIVALVLFSIGYFSFPVVKDFAVSLFPPKEKPAAIYGKLPKIKFSGLTISPSKTPEYIINTKDGRLPNISLPLLSVYKVNKPQVSFFAGKNAQNNAAALLLSDQNLVTNLSGGEYKWVDSALSRQLTINIGTNTLDYTVNFITNRDSYTQGAVGLGSGSTSYAISTLSSLGFYRDPLYTQRGFQKVVYGKIVGNEIKETSTPSEYAFVKVDFFRTISKAPIVTPRYDDGLLQVVYGSPTKDPQALKNLRIRAHEWSINVDNYGRYPTITVGEAWKRLTNGSGIIAKAKLKTASAFEPYVQIPVSKFFFEQIEIGYYDSAEYQEYMQPVYIFKGTFTTPEGQAGDAVVYIPAIADAYYK